MDEDVDVVHRLVNGAGKAVEAVQPAAEPVDHRREFRI